MEVELDLWSSRSNDPVDHILSDVDCLSDVPDVDEFILGCSSSTPEHPFHQHQLSLPKTDLSVSSVDAMHQLHMNHHHHHHHVSYQQPFLEETNNMRHQQPHHHQQQQQQQQHQHLTTGQHGQFNQQQRPSPASAEADCCVDDLTSSHLSGSLVEHLEVPGGSQVAQSGAQQRRPTLLQQQQQQFKGQHLLNQQQQQLLHYNTNNLVSSNLPATSTSSVVSSSAASPLYSNGQQQNGMPILVDQSLVASRVDHCYILSDQQQQQQQHSQQVAAGSGLGVTSTSSSSGSSSLHESSASTVTDQLQLLLNSQPVAVRCNVNNEPASPTKEQPPKGGTKRRQSMPANSSNSGSAGKRSKQATSCDASGAPVAKGKPRSNAKQQHQQQQVSSSSKNPSSSSKQSRSRQSSPAISTSHAALATPASSSTSELEVKQEAVAKKARTNSRRNKAPASGQTSPTLSSSSSSGVSSLSFSSSASNSSASELLDSSGEQQTTSGASSPSSSAGEAVGGKQSKRQPKKQQVMTAVDSKGKPAMTATTSAAKAQANQLGKVKSPIKLEEQPLLSFSSDTLRKEQALGYKGEKLAGGSSSTTTTTSSSSSSSSSNSTTTLAKVTTLKQGKDNSIKQPPSFSLTKLLQSQPSQPISSSTAANQQSSVAEKLFGANLSASSRQKLNSLTSCLIINTPQASSSCSSLSSSASGAADSSGAKPATGRLEPTPASPISSSSHDCQQQPPLSSSANSGSGSGSSANAAGKPAVSSSPSSSSPSSCLSSSLSSTSSSSSSSSPSSSISSAASSASSSPTMQLGGAQTQQQANQPASSFSSPTAISTINLISNQDWKSAQSGQMVVLTDEERRTLIAEGYPIPQRFPLSKAEERSLKKIRRKIKNKISAQESRRKKKEYMEELEKKVQMMEIRILELEQENRLMKQQQQQQQQQLAASSKPAIVQVLESGKFSTTSAKPAPVQLSKEETTQMRHPQQQQLPDVNLTINAKRDDKQKPSTSDVVVSVDAAANLIHDKQQQQVHLHSTQADSSLPTNGLVKQQPAGAIQAASQQRKISTTAPATEDDFFIDHILMSQERQENNQQLVNEDEVDLVANLVGVVCESDNLVDISVVKSICDQMMTTTTSVTSDDTAQRATINEQTAVDDGSQRSRRSRSETATLKAAAESNLVLGIKVEDFQEPSASST